MVSTHMRGAVIPTSVSKGFLRACILGRGIQFHASAYKQPIFGYWMGRTRKDYEQDLLSGEVCKVALLYARPICHAVSLCTRHQGRSV